jgi:hypothetical protein
MRGNQKKALTRLYDELCDHYRMQPTRNNTGIAHENGSIEAPHGHLKNRIKQAVYYAAAVILRLSRSIGYWWKQPWLALTDNVNRNLNRRNSVSNRCPNIGYQTMNF